MIFAFGEYELDEERFELRRSGCPVEVQPKVLAILLHLVRHRDRVVSKKDLLAAVWPDTVVTENSVARAVSLARLAVGDRVAKPVAIVNVARRGYAFRIPVRVLSAGAGRLVGENESRESRYVGRAQLRARLHDALDDALSGSGRVLFLAGEAGIGKTRTAELLIERARARGAAVSAGSGQEDDATTYQPWMRLLRGVASAAPGARGDLSPEQRNDLALLLPEPGVAPPAADSCDAVAEGNRLPLFEAVLAFLARAAALVPLALFFDDLHAADTESLALLEFVSQGIGALPIALIATRREPEARRAPETDRKADADREQEGSRTPQRSRWIDRLLRATTLERWPLDGLRREEIEAFARLHLGREPAPALVVALEQQTQGNPLLLGESLRSLEARGLIAESRTSDEWEALLPSGIRHLLQPKLEGLSPDGREPLGCALAFGVEVERALLRRCVADPAALDRHVQEWEEAGFVVASADAARLRVSHVLVREALYAELVPPGDARRAVHARIAAVLEEQGSSSPESVAARARHACEAVPSVPVSKAVALAEAAAAQATRLADFDGAAAWHQRALDALERGGSDDVEARIGVLLGFGAAQTRASGAERAQASYGTAGDLARSIRRFDLFGEAALGFAHQPSASGQSDPEVLDLLEEALQQLPPAHEALRIRLLARLAAELRYLDSRRAEARMDEALAAARQLGDAEVLAQALEDCSFLRWSPADTEGWIALNSEIVRTARAAGDLELALRGQKGRVTGLLELGDLVGVDRELRACERTAGTLRTPYARWLVATLGAMRALLDGDLGGAERHVMEAHALGQRVESTDVAVELQAQVVYLRHEQGRTAEVEPAIRAQVQRFREAPAWRAVLARALVATGRIPEARRELGVLARRGFADVPRDRGWLMTLALAGEVAAATGDERAAAALERHLIPYARLAVVGGSGGLYYGSVAHHLGVLAAARSEWDAALGHLEAALAREVRAGARLWEARTRLARARVLRDRGDPADQDRAGALVAEASAAASARGWSAVAAEAQELAAGPPPSPSLPRHSGRRARSS